MYEICLSMLEIYNEELYDLLSPIPDLLELNNGNDSNNNKDNGKDIKIKKEGKKSGLTIRESKFYGVFVDGITNYPITSKEEFDSMVYNY